MEGGLLGILFRGTGVHHCNLLEDIDSLRRWREAGRGERPGCRGRIAFCDAKELIGSELDLKIC